MADDARTEAHRRIAVAAHRLVCSGCNGDCDDRDESDWDVADAVLDLFPDVEWHGLLNVSTGVRSQRLVLHGLAEPVTKESPDGR